MKIRIAVCPRFNVRALTRIKKERTVIPAFFRSWNDLSIIAYRLSPLAPTSFYEVSATLNKQLKSHLFNQNLSSSLKNSFN